MNLISTPDYAAYRERLKVFEGTTGWMYRDSAAAGNCTVGCGHMIPDLAHALTLPFAGGDVAADWAKVMAAPMGMAASRYAPLSDSRLSPQAIDLTLDADLAIHLHDLLARYPWVGTLRIGAQLALLDMHFNLRAPKLDGYPHMMALLKSGDYAGAAAASHRNGVSADRNGWTGVMMASA